MLVENKNKIERRKKSCLKLSSIIIVLCELALFVYTFKYQFFKNRPFPFIDSEKTGGGSKKNLILIFKKNIYIKLGEGGEEAGTQRCLDLNKGDGNCDEQNNNINCNWDGGDCCAVTCIKNCEEKNKTSTPCEKKCGVNPYNCLNNGTVGCSECSKNGVCVDMKICMSSDKKQYDPVELGVSNIIKKIIDFSMQY
jgi:hypothetical protein